VTHAAEIRHREVGVCGLSCRLCLHFFTVGESRCAGCKSEGRMAVGCPFITCAVKRRGIEFCWECDERGGCARWRGHREYGREHDTFVCYAALERTIARIDRDGIEAFVGEQRVREELLGAMLAEFNEGRSKTYFSIAATLLELEELRAALASARRETAGEGEVRARSRVLHAHLDAAAAARSLCLKLRR
jgi:hypothetical protein